MIIIKYKVQTPVLEEVEARLKAMTLDYRLQQSEVSDVRIEDGTQTAEGKAAIQVYLEELASELKQWHYCSC